MALTLERQVLCRMSRIKVDMVTRQKAKGAYPCSQLWRLHPHQQLNWHHTIQQRRQPPSRSPTVKRHHRLLMQPVGLDLRLQQHTSSLTLSLQQELSIRKQFLRTPFLVHPSAR